MSNAIAHIHKGHSSATDMFSLERFKVLLGKTKLMAPKPPFQAQESFHEIVFESLVLCASMEELGCKDLDTLKERMKTCHFNQLIKRLCKEFFDLKKVAGERDKRIQRSAARGRGGAQRGRGQGRGRGRGRMGRARGDTGRMIAENNDENGGGVVDSSPATQDHDQVRENATLCMQHLAFARLFHEGIRMGDSGVVEGMLDILTLFFHGTNNSRYAGEFLLQNINRRALWTPFYHQVWLDNCLVNISGRPNCWLSLDEVCEITVDQLKNDYNPRGSWQSRDYHLNVVSPNIHLLRIIKEQVMRSSWASTGGLKKGAVSIKKDVSVLCRVLIEEGALIMTPGRVALERVLEGDKVELRTYQEASDPVEIGIRNLRDKDIPSVLEKIKEKQSLFFEEAGDIEAIDEEEIELIDITRGVEVNGGLDLMI